MNRSVVKVVNRGWFVTPPPPPPRALPPTTAPIVSRMVAMVVCTIARQSKAKVKGYTSTWSGLGVEFRSNIPQSPTSLVPTTRYVRDVKSERDVNVS